jgi:uncharacterized membrane protein
MKRIIGFFFQGVLFTVPIAVTLFVIYKIFILVDGILSPIINEILPFQIPGLGLVIILGLLTFFGFLGSTIIMRPIFSYFERLVEKAPLAKIIYSAVKDLLQAFVGNKKSFDKPVLVRLEKDSDVQKIGFITQDDLTDLGLDHDHVAVYLPHSYAWSGNQFIVPKENITPLNVSAATVMKFIVSGGVTKLDKEETDQNQRNE